MRALDAPDDYWSADDQLTPTVGPHMGGLEDVEAADDETVRAVYEAITGPRQLEDPEPDNPSAFAMRADGSTGELPQHIIPGFGEPYGDDHEHGACGDPIPLVCSGCGHTTEVGRTCRRSTCPRCGAAWVRDRAVPITSRLATVRAVRDKNRDLHQRGHHWVAIPPADWRLEADDVLDRTFRVVGDLIRAFDHDGVAFYHPWSGSSYEDDADELEDDRGKWKDRLFSGRDWEGDVRDELSHRPHFHILSVGHFVPGSDLTRELYNETGWILKRITKGENSSVSLYDDEDLAAAATYCLSHTGIDRSRASDGSAQMDVRRYGTLMHDSEIDVRDEVRDRHDILCRRAATTTLGIPLADQFCLAETVGDTSADPSLGIRSQVIAQAAADEPASPDADGTTSDLEQADASTLPDAPTPVDATEPLSTPADRDGDLSLDLDEDEIDECEGKMVHLIEARDLLEDDDWVENAQHVGELQTTLDQWADKLDELIRWGPHNSG